VGLPITVAGCHRVIASVADLEEKVGFIDANEARAFQAVQDAGHRNRAKLSVSRGSEKVPDAYQTIWCGRMRANQRNNGLIYIIMVV
jgi:hypothetical protein